MVVEERVLEPDGVVPPGHEPRHPDDGAEGDGREEPAAEPLAVSAHADTLPTMPDRTVSAPAATSTGPGPALRVRPPHPLAPSARLVLVAMGLVVLVIGALVLRSAVADDEAAGYRARARRAAAAGRLHPRRLRRVRSARPLRPGAVERRSRGRGSVARGWSRRGLPAPTSPSSRRAIATWCSTPRSCRPDRGAAWWWPTRPGDRVELLVDRAGTGWQVVRTQGGTRRLLQLVPGPTADVTLQVVRRPDLLTVAFDGEVRRRSPWRAGRSPAPRRDWWPTAPAPASIGSPTCPSTLDDGGVTTHRPFDAPRGVVVDAVTRALAEDLTPLGDISAALLPPEATCHRGPVRGAHPRRDRRHRLRRRGVRPGQTTTSRWPGR